MSVSVDGAPDLVLALDGGEKFAQRLQELVQAKQDSDHAVQELSLGRSAKEHMAAAEARMGEVASLEAKAREAADAIIADAKRQADAIHADAEEMNHRKFSALQAEISAARAEFEKWQADMNAATQADSEHASKLLAEAKDKNAAADAALSDAAMLKMNAEKSEAVLRQALAEAQAAKDEHEALTARIKAAVG